jgi:CheY-like chemotaxis protein
MEASLNGRTALVVEDDWLLRQGIVNELQDVGLTVLEAATGGGALTILRDRQEVDLLVTDIQLTDAVAGWDVAEAFRGVNAKLPVIYASGNPSNNHRRVAGSVFLGKPVEPSKLVKACGELLTQSMSR